MTHRDGTTLTPGQTVAFHKYKWQILAWKAIQGELTIHHSTNDTLILKDNKGGAALIKFLEPDQPNKGLRYLLCPDGNQHHQYRVVYVAIKELCTKVGAAQLTEKETRQALFQRLYTKLDYGLRSIKASLWVEKSWQPKLQRANNFSLMEEFLRVKTTPLERKHLRMALHFMRVVTLADIADPKGSMIPGHKLTGDWRANTAGEWPKQPQPPKTAFAIKSYFVGVCVFTVQLVLSRIDICLDTAYVVSFSTTYRKQDSAPCYHM